jgi:hypothetical protein
MRADSVFEKNIALVFIKSKTFADIPVQPGLLINLTIGLNGSKKRRHCCFYAKMEPVAFCALPRSQTLHNCFQIIPLK